MRTDFCLLDHLAAMRVSYKTIKNNNNVSNFFNVTVSQGHERTLTLIVKSRARSSRCCGVKVGVGKMLGILAYYCWSPNKPHQWEGK